jgi:hypothetical protein
MKLEELEILDIDPSSVPVAWDRRKRYKPYTDGKEKARLLLYKGKPVASWSEKYGISIWGIPESSILDSVYQSLTARFIYLE